MEYSCRKIEKDLDINGDLEKPEWAAAETISLVETETGGEVSQKTLVKLLWNTEYLYAGFYCEDDYVRATKTGYNDRLYEEDVVEIFIDDDKDRKTYIEIEVNPLNAVLHYGIQNDPARGIIQFARVQKVVRSAVLQNMDEKYITVEMAIPLTEFFGAANIPPKAGDSWLFNAYRIDRAEYGKDEYSAWSPTGRINFHLPQAFGELIFEGE